MIRREGKSRFDARPDGLYPPGERAPPKPGGKWDVQPDENITRQAILEDYFLEDGLSHVRSKKVKDCEEPEDPRINLWQRIPESSDLDPRLRPDSPKKDATPPKWGRDIVKPSSPASSKVMEQPAIPGTTWQPPINQPSNQSSTAYPSYGQLGYDQNNYYNYDYQQYGYQNYYQGYSDYSQGWGSQQTQQPPSIVLPDMTQPPPIPVQQQPADLPIPPVPPSDPNPISTTPKSKSTVPDPEPQKTEEAKKEAIKKEQKQQAQTLLKQREEYLRKSTVLSRELEILKEQKKELMEEGSSDNARILKENSKLQEEIKNKLKAINNVVDMLSGIMGNKNEDHDHKRSKSESKERETGDDKPTKRSSSSSSSSSDEVEAESATAELTNGKVNYQFFDPEEHWCRVCEEFPSTAKEYLNHLLTDEHMENSKKKGVEQPWRKNLEDDRPYHEGAPMKRIPIKGLQFFIASTAWYCKLCDTWIGDLKCASLHLKSVKHTSNYENYVTINPDWEGMWDSEREKAQARKNEEQRHMRELMRVRQLVQNEDMVPPNLEEKIKVGSPGGWALPTMDSPISIRESIKVSIHNNTVTAEQQQQQQKEEEDRSRSIRVAMRNKAKPSDPKLSPMGPVLPPNLDPVSTVKVNQEKSTISNSKWITQPAPVSTQQSNGEKPGTWPVKSTNSNIISENEKEMLRNLKEKHKLKIEREEPRKKDDRRLDRKRDRRYRERSRDYEGNWIGDRSRSRSRGRDGRDYGRDLERDRSHSRERRRRRRSSSPRRGRSRTPERKVRKSEVPKSWMAPPSSPPPYLPKRMEEKDKWDKPKRKPAPNPVSNLPKSKLPFIGKMPLLRRIAQKKQGDESDRAETSQDDSAGHGRDRKPLDDMEIDSGLSDNDEEAPVVESAHDCAPTMPALATETVVVEEVVTTKEPPKTAEAGGIPLPQDFQDALEILFPVDLPPEEQEEAVAALGSPPPHAPKRVCNISEEELMMLGIDPEDMVAQGLSSGP